MNGQNKNCSAQNLDQSFLNEFYILFSSVSLHDVSFLFISVTLHWVCFCNPVLNGNLGIGQKPWGTL